MIEKIKEKIDNNKQDNSSYKKYIKSFCELDKANELFQNNEDFRNIKKTYTKKEQEEDY